MFRFLMIIDFGMTTTKARQCQYHRCHVELSGTTDKSCNHDENNKIRLQKYVPLKDLSGTKVCPNYSLSSVHR